MMYGITKTGSYFIALLLFTCLLMPVQTFAGTTIIKCNIFGYNIKITGSFDCNSKEVKEKIKQLEAKVLTMVDRSELELMLKKREQFEEEVQSSLANVSKLDDDLKQAGKERRRIESALDGFQTILNRVDREILEESARREADTRRLQETFDNFSDIIELKLHSNSSDLRALQGYMDEVVSAFNNRVDEMDIKYQMIMRELKISKQHLSFLGGGFSGFNTEGVTRGNWLVQYDLRLEHFFPTQTFPPSVTIGVSRVFWPLKKEFSTFNELEKVSYTQNLDFDYFDVGLNFLTPASKQNIRWFAGGSAGYSPNKHVNWLLALRGGLEYSFPKIRVIAELRYQYLLEVTQEERTFNPFGDTFSKEIQKDEKFLMLGTRILYGI